MRSILRTAPARLIIFTVSLFALLILLQTGARLVTHAVQGATRALLAVVLELIVCAVMILAYRAEVRWLERRRADEIGAAGSVPPALGGLLLGAALFTAVYAVLWCAGAVTYAGPGSVTGAVTTAGLSAAAAVGEEIIFRGGVFRILQEWLGTTIAVAASAAFFGGLHLVNPGATLFGALAIALEAGVLLAVAYALTHRLWLAIGIHFGWNFTEGGIFGAAISGGRHSAGLMNFTLSGPPLLTGGKFGPEASVVALLLCLAVAVVLGYLTVKRGRWQPRVNPGLTT
ncbi:MAG: CPBP family intramembrane glutamic endopeptidase [Steroidobacteraceae bacterium]